MKKYAHFLGKKHTEETKEKIRLSKLGDKNPMKNPINAKKLSDTLIREGTYAGENNPRWKGGHRKNRGSNKILRPNQHITKTCESCGDSFEIKKNRVATAKYCSKECVSLGYKKRMIGSHNPNFKKGNFIGTAGSSVRRERMRRASNIKTHTAKEWEDLKFIHNDKCARCKNRKPLQKDHIVPVSKGGHNGIDNIQPLCKRCNVKKFTKTVDYISQERMFPKEVIQPEQIKIL